MKTLLIFLTASLTTSFADCVLPGLHSFVHRNGLPPVCGVVGTTGFITLNGDSRFSWSSLRVGPGEAMQSLQISGNYASSHVVRGPLAVSGILSSQGPLALFASQVTTAPTAQISAPKLVISALLPNSDADTDDFLLTDTPKTLTSKAEPGTTLPGIVENRGQLTATATDLTIIGRGVRNTGQINATSGTVNLVAAEKVAASRNQVTAKKATFGQPNEIFNGGRIEGVRVEMRALAQACFDDSCEYTIDYPIINAGTLRGSARQRGVTFDVSGANETPLHAQSIVENRRGSGTIITRDSRPILQNNPDYVKGGTFENNGRVIMPNDGDRPAVTPTRFPGSSNQRPSTPLLPPTSAAGVVLTTQATAAKATTATSSTRSTGTRGSNSTEEAPKRPKLRKPIVRGTFAGIPVKG
jgi:hypothetical protein